LNIGLQCTSLPGMSGNCLIARDKMPKDLGVNVEKALRTKLPKLVKTRAARRVLLFERDQTGGGSPCCSDDVTVCAFNRNCFLIKVSISTSVISPRRVLANHNEEYEQTGVLLNCP
jgi:hypothetical protein